MFKKIILTIASMAFFVGCDYPPVEVDSCEAFNKAGLNCVTSNMYRNDITIDSYRVNYGHGVLSKELQTYSDGNVISSGYVPRGKSRFLVALYISKLCSETEEEFASFMTVFHLDANRTYTVAGFTKEMDQEHNITGGKGADIYNMGYMRNNIQYSAYENTDINIDITQTGEFTFTAGE